MAARPAASAAAGRRRLNMGYSRRLQSEIETIFNNPLILGKKLSRNMANAPQGVARRRGPAISLSCERGVAMNGQDENEKPDGEDPSREGYDWPSIALFAIFLGTFIYAFLQR
jgi:hypothetical protein